MPTGKHVIDLEPEQSAYDECVNCRKAIQVRTDTGELVTTLGWNAECYGRRP